MPDKSLILSREELENILAKALASPPPGSDMSLTDERLGEITENAIKRAFVTIGIASDDPLEMQKDFAFIRTLRKGTEGLKKQGFGAAVGVVITAVVTLLGMWAKSVFSGKP